MMASVEMQLTIPNMADRGFFKGLNTKKGQKMGVKRDILWMAAVKLISLTTF